MLAAPTNSEARRPAAAPSVWQCFVEAAVSSIVKHGLRRIDLGKLTRRALDNAYGGDAWIDEARIDAVCSAKRTPPRAPEEVARLLAASKVFTNATDATVVAALYRECFEAIAESVSSLCFARLSWGVGEVSALLEVLPRFERLTSLDLAHNHNLGLMGGEALAHAAATFSQWQWLDLDGCPLPLRDLDGSAASAPPAIELSQRGLRNGSALVIARLLPSNRTLTSLDLRANAIGPPAAVRLAAAALDCPALVSFGSVPVADLRADGLTELDVSNRTLMAPECCALATLVSRTTRLHALDLRFNGLDDEVALGPLAAALKSALALTTVDVSSNPLRPEAEQALRDIVQGRAPHSSRGS